MKSRRFTDGALFVLAHGTNPEVLVLIEAIGDSIDKARWHYGLARCGSAEMHVAIDGKEVWTVGRTPGVAGKPTDPYWLFTSALDRPARPCRERQIIWPPDLQFRHIVFIMLA